MRNQAGVGSGKLMENYRFQNLVVSSKTPTLLSLEDLIQVQQNNVGNNEEEEYITPIATSFHSGCLVHGSYSQLVVVGGCFDTDDEEYHAEEEKTNALMAYSYMKDKWEMLFNLFLTESTNAGEEDDSNEFEQIAHMNISSDEQYLTSSMQSSLRQQSEEECSKLRENVPPRIWGHSCVYSPLTKSIYIFGGIKNDDIYNDCLFSFSLERRVWKKVDAQYDESLEGLPCGRQGHRTVYIAQHHKIIMFGGFSDSHLSDFHEYDVKRNMWSKVEEDSDFKVNRPSSREVFSMVYSEHRNSILIFGGKTEDERYSDLHEYSFTTKRWTLLHPGQSNKNVIKSTMKSEPSNRSSHTAVFLEKYQKMIVLSGYNGEEWFSDCYEFDLNKMEWSFINLRLTGLSEAESEFFSGGFSSHIAEFNTVTNEIMVFGGWDGDVDSNSLFSIKIPTLESVEMQFKLNNMNELFSDVSIQCSKYEN